MDLEYFEKQSNSFTDTLEKVNDLLSTYKFMIKEINEKKEISDIDKLRKFYIEQEMLDLVIKKFSFKK
jgi:hypothetical protein